MASILKCSFSVYSEKSCNLSTRYPNSSNLVTLNVCDKDTSRHLKGCYKTSAVGVENEAKLCLARAGLFEESGDTLTICPLHRDEFGLGFRPSKSCKYPLHDCKQKPTRGISRQISQDVFYRFGVLCETGQGKSKHKPD